MRHSSLILWASLITASAAIAGDRTIAAAPGTQAGSHFRDCPHCPMMVVVPPGTFTMGSPGDEAGRFGNEGPQHAVTIARAFAMSMYDVTVSDYRRFVRATGRAVTNDCRIYDPAFIEPQLVRVHGKNWSRPNFVQTGRHPVVCVTFDDAGAYVAWLNGMVAKHSGDHPSSGPYRLPSEAEWEYAARAGSQTPFYWGSVIRRSDANYGPDEPAFAPVAKGPDRWGYTSPVGSFPANPFGLYDMAGNVWQFTEDCWSATYDGSPADGAPRVGDRCSERAVRGGSWFKPPAGERSAKRGEGTVSDLKGSSEIGFRVVRDLNVGP